MERYAHQRHWKQDDKDISDNVKNTTPGILTQDVYTVCLQQVPIAPHVIKMFSAHEEAREREDDGP